MSLDDDLISADVFYCHSVDGDLLAGALAAIPRVELLNRFMDGRLSFCFDDKIVSTWLESSLCISTEHRPI